MTDTAAARDAPPRQGPLASLRVLEFAGIGPAPFAGMLLSDLGAEVVRVQRPGAPKGPDDRVIARGRRVLSLDLKRPESVEACLELCGAADVLIEGFRPGVMERLGLGPEPAPARNPQLVYGRMTGWGQTGPLAQAAGHDINYIALSGALHAAGEADKPRPPANLLGDFGGGALYLAFGLLAAVTHARSGGRGQVIDCAIVDGTASLMALVYALRAKGLWSDERASNLLDGGAPFYDTYRCADGRWISVGALEPQFYQQLLEKMGLDPVRFAAQLDRRLWPELRAALTEAFERRTQAEWCAALEGSDACFAPVLSMEAAPDHPHNRARGVFREADGGVQPAPAPRFSETPGAIQAGSAVEVRDLLRSWRRRA